MAAEGGKYLHLGIVNIITIGIMGLIFFGAYGAARSWWKSRNAS